MPSPHRKSTASHFASTGCAQMDIQFDRSPPNYSAGEAVCGRLVLEIKQTPGDEINAQKGRSEDSALVARNLTVSILGDAHNAWVSKSSDKIYESSENYVNECSALVEKPTEFKFGKHEFPFRFQLPSTLPSSYESEYGRICYVVHASLYLNTNFLPSTAARSDAYVQRRFAVTSRLALSTVPETRQPVEAIDATEYSCCCVPLGSVRAVITVPKNGYAINESIPVSATVFNGTRKTIRRANVSLVQHAKFVARSRYEHAQDTKERRYCIASINKGIIEPGKFLRMDNELIAFPPLPPSYRGSIVSIDYEIVFEADPGLEITIPITIGTNE